MSSDAGHRNNASHQTCEGDSSETETPESEATAMSLPPHTEDPLVVMDLILDDLRALHDRLKERDLLDAPLPLLK